MANRIFSLVVVEVVADFVDIEEACAGNVRCAILGAGVAVPLMLAGLVVVSFRGYGIMDEPPQGPQVYTSF